MFPQLKAFNVHNFNITFKLYWNSKYIYNPSFETIWIFIHNLLFSNRETSAGRSSSELHYPIAIKNSLHLMKHIYKIRNNYICIWCYVAHAFALKYVYSVRYMVHFNYIFLSITTSHHKMRKWAYAQHSNSHIAARFLYINFHSEHA